MLEPQLHKLLKRPLPRRLSLVFIIGALMLGASLMVMIFAAGTPVAFESESGTLAAGAAVQTDASASGGQAVKFASGGFTVGSTKPDAINTGPRISLQAPSVKAGVSMNASGDITVTAANVTISGWDIRGYVIVNANNFTLVDSRVHGRPNPGADSGAGYVQKALVVIASGVTGTTVSYSEIATDEYDGAWVNGVSGANFSVTHCNMHDTVDQFDVDSPGNVLMEANYLHDGTFSDIDGDHKTDSSHPYWTHQDGVQIKGGSGITIRGNNFSTYASQTTSHDPNHYHTGAALGSDTVHPWNNYGGSVTSSPLNGWSVHGLLIEQNWFDGGDANFQMSILNPDGNNSIGTIQNNRFGRDQHLYPGSTDSRYQIRYAVGNELTGLTTNYWDPQATTVPTADLGRYFAVGYNNGIRSP